MSRNGSGTYSLPSNSWNPATNGTPATAADWQTLINDVAAALTQSLSKDGQTPLTGNLAAGGNKVTGLAAASANGDAVRYEQIPTLASLGAAASGANSDITSLTGLASINGGQLAGLRNRIINGGMQVAQRGSVALSNGVLVYGGCDRTVGFPSGFTTATGTVQQSAFSQGTSGFAQQVNTTTTGSGTVNFVQKIEALNIKDLNSKTITVSGVLYQDTGSALNAVISLYKTGTVDNWASPTLISTSTVTSIPSAAATQISKQFTLGASDATNGLYVQVQFQGVGAVTSKNFYLGDLQLEKGSTATTFEQRPYGMELALCQRYYESGIAPRGTNYGASAQRVNVSTPFRVTKRVTPATATIATGAIDLATVDWLQTYSLSVAAGAEYNPATYTASSEL